MSELGGSSVNPFAKYFGRRFTQRVRFGKLQDVVAHAIREATATEEPLGEALELQSLAGHWAGRGVHEMEVERIVKALSWFPENGTCQRS